MTPQLNKLIESINQGDTGSLTAGVLWLLAEAGNLRRRMEELEKRQPTDKELKQWWVSQGGDIHGPNIETWTMPEEKILPLLKGLMGAKP